MATACKITGNIGNHYPGDPRRVRARAVLNIPPNSAVVDTATNTVHTREVPIHLADDGSFEVDLLPTGSADLNVTGLRWTIELSVVEQVNGVRVRRVIPLGPFEVDGDAELRDLADQFDGPDVTPAWYSAFRAEILALVEELVGGGGGGGGNDPDPEPEDPAEEEPLPGWLKTPENVGLASKGVTEADLTTATYPDFGGNRLYPNVSGYQYRKKFTKEVAAAPGTVFEQCLFTSTGALVTPCGDGVVIKDSDLVNTGNAGTLVFVDPYFTGAQSTTTTMQNLRMTGGEIFINVTNAGAIVEDVYGYNQTAGAPGNDLHRDGFTCRGRDDETAAPIVVRRSWFDTAQPAGTTGALFLKDDEPTDGNPLVGVEIYQSFLTGMGYCMGFSNVHGIVVEDCRTRPADNPNAYGDIMVQGDVSMASWVDNHRWANDPANDYRGAALEDPSTVSWPPDEDPENPEDPEDPVDPEEPEEPVDPVDPVDPPTTYTVYAGDYPHTLAMHDNEGDITVANSFHLTSGTASCVGARLWLPAGHALSAPVRVAAWGGQNLDGTPVREVNLTDLVEGWNEVTWDTPIPMTADTPLWIGWSSANTWYMAYSPAPEAEVASTALPALRLSAATGLGWGRSVYSVSSGTNTQGGNALWGVDIIVTA